MLLWVCPEMNRHPSNVILSGANPEESASIKAAAKKKKSPQKFGM